MAPVPRRWKSSNGRSSHRKSIHWNWFFITWYFLAWFSSSWNMLGWISRLNSVGWVNLSHEFHYEFHTKFLNDYNHRVPCCDENHSSSVWTTLASFHYNFHYAIHQTLFHKTASLSAVSSVVHWLSIYSAFRAFTVVFFSQSVEPGIFQWHWQHRRIDPTAALVEWASWMHVQEV